jgi:fumarate reductase subunit D
LCVAHVDFSLSFALPTGIVFTVHCLLLGLLLGLLFADALGQAALAWVESPITLLLLLSWTLAIE